nr:DUF6338 family protein [Azospirillum ramasamyi]
MPASAASPSATNGAPTSSLPFTISRPASSAGASSRDGSVRRSKPSEQAFTYLALSGLNYGLFSPLIYAVLYLDWFKSHQIVSLFSWFFVMFIGPFTLAIISAYSIKHHWFTKVARKFGLNPVNVFPTSWDRKFCHQTEGCFVIVTLKNDSEIFGYYGVNSFSSSEPTERDIYIEQMYDVSDKGEWTEGPSGKGILILHSEIRCVEFIPVNGASADDRKEAANPAAALTAAGVDKEELQPA